MLCSVIFLTNYNNCSKLYINLADEPSPSTHIAERKTNHGNTLENVTDTEAVVQALLDRSSGGS